MKEKEIQERIRDYFQSISDYTPVFDENLFESGVLDSFGIVEFLNFLQVQLQTEIPIEDITEENFSTIASISRLIVHKKAKKKE